MTMTIKEHTLMKQIILTETTLKDCHAGDTVRLHDADSAEWTILPGVTTDGYLVLRYLRDTTRTQLASLSRAVFLVERREV